MPVACAAIFASLLSGCTRAAPQEAKVTSEFTSLPTKQVDDVLKGTIWEQVDLGNADPVRVSGYGLVVGLQGTGDTRAPNPVREYMMRQMQKRGFGNANIPGFGAVGPEQVLNDSLKRTAIVRVDAFIPPGARRGQSVDAQVSALENSNTTSLNRGILYSTELAPRGADPFNPGGGVTNPWARSAGSITINPNLAVQDGELSAQQKLSLRYGVVMGQGVVVDERPLVLKLRQPENRMARLIERRIQDRFQNSKIASAKNPSQVFVTVPLEYGQDWEHFIGVVTHLYFNYTAEFGTLQAKKIAEVAVRDREKAPLMDISYCWEGIGQPALPAVRSLLTSDSPDVAFAAARAGAFLGDSASQETLCMMAQTRGHPFELNAIRILSALKPNVRTQTVLRKLLDRDSVLARVEAYRAMLTTQDAFIVSRPVRESFTIDLLPSTGPAIVYATRVGTPRIAFIGERSVLARGALFLALNNTLTIAADDDRRSAKIYYRGGLGEDATSIEASQDSAVIAGRLGGDAPSGEPRINLAYADVVGLLQRMCDQKLFVGASGRPATFVLEMLPGLDDPIMGAPSIPDQRPQGDTPSDAPTIPDAPVSNKPAASEPLIAPTLEGRPQK